jgi:hypothetical protein
MKELERNYTGNEKSKYSRKGKSALYEFIRGSPEGSKG